MHIHLSHRHFVSAPIFALLLTLPFLLSGSHNLGADVLAASSPVSIGAARQTAFSFPDGTYGQVGENGRIVRDGDGTHLYEGDALVSTLGLSALHVDRLTLQGFHGTFYASKSPTAVSIAALTTPVLVSKGQYRLLIPAGMQGRFAAADVPSDFDPQQSAADMQRLVGVPDDFIQGQLQALAHVPAPSSIQAPDPIPSLPSPSILQLPAARQRAQEQAMSAFLADLDKVLADGGQETIHTLLQSPLVASIPSSPTAQAMLPQLLADSLAHQQQTLTVFTWVQDPDLWLLASAYPGLQASAWAAATPATVPPGYQTLRLLTFPLTDLGPEPAPSIARDKWAQEARDFAASQKDPTPFLTSLLPVMDTYRTTAQKRDFPERLQEYAKAMQQMVDPSVTLNDELKTELQSWNQ